MSDGEPTRCQCLDEIAAALPARIWELMALFLRRIDPPGRKASGRSGEPLSRLLIEVG